MHTAHAELQTSIAADAELSAARQPLLPNSSDHPTALVLGGGLCGLACAHELVGRGIATVVVDGAEPGLAPASSAAAGLLDPLSVKGRVMWQGEAAFAAAVQLVRAAEPSALERLGILHVPSSPKQAEQLRRSADEAAAGAAFGSRWVDEAEAQRLAPGATLPCGGLLCADGCVVDTASYLRALWRLVQAMGAERGVPTQWVVRRSCRAAWVRRHADSFDHVIVAAGAGCAALEETRHLPVDLCRGQTLLYSLGATARGGERRQHDEATAPLAAVDAASPPTPTGDAEGCEAGPSGGAEGPPRPNVALSGAVYVLPVGGRLICGGTHEPCDDARQLAPPCARDALAALGPSLSALYPPLAALAAPTARAGVRALPPRSAEGALPLAGLAHTDAPRRNVWFVGGMGARGLLYHALAARWVVDAALAGDPALIPTLLRRGEFGALLHARLARLADKDVER